MPDFRLPEYRREVFLSFYEFHLKYRTMPGCVYFLMPYLTTRYGWEEEEKLWFAYINGNTQNPVTSWLIFRRFPDPHHMKLSILEQFFNDHWAILQWDMDRRYQKKDFVKNVAWYQKEIGGGQESYFYNSFTHGDEGENFQAAWKHVRKEFPTFGRLSAFSYLEYLRIMGLPIDCDDLFLEDISGSESHRNGLAIVLGKDELYFHNKKPIYTQSAMQFLKDEAERLLLEAKTIFRDKDFYKDVSYFTLESALCTYKSWHRPNRRYPNVYADMLHDRIRWAEERWPREPLNMFWEARETYLPWYLRQESNSLDPGLSKEKQNYYREHGVPVMMSKDFPEFDNDFDRRIWNDNITPTNSGAKSTLM